MRCFFHLVSPMETVPDSDGIEVLSVDAALCEAQSAIDELRREDPDLFDGQSGWNLQVVDESDRVLHVFDLRGDVRGARISVTGNLSVFQQVAAGFTLPDCSRGLC